MGSNVHVYAEEGCYGENGLPPRLFAIVCAQKGCHVVSFLARAERSGIMERLAFQLVTTPIAATAR